MMTIRGRSRPDFNDDDGFTASWWGENADLGPPDHQWRSYTWNGEEVARLLLSLRYSSHWNPTVPALMVWSFEVRRDLQRREAHVGTRIIEALVAEYRGREIYVGPTPDSIGFWQQFDWSMCDCEECGGRDFIIRRP